MFDPTNVSSCRKCAVIQTLTASTECTKLCREKKKKTNKVGSYIRGLYLKLCVLEACAGIIKQSMEA
jgi:hypothetical protein